jgi:hypothetical protein
MAQYPGDSGSILRQSKGGVHVDVTDSDASVIGYLGIINNYLEKTTEKTWRTLNCKKESAAAVCPLAGVQLRSASA